MPSPLRGVGLTWASRSLFSFCSTVLLLCPDGASGAQPAGFGPWGCAHPLLSCPPTACSSRLRPRMRVCSLPRGSPGVAEVQLCRAAVAWLDTIGLWWLIRWLRRLCPAFPPQFACGVGLWLIRWPRFDVAAMSRPPSRLSKHGLTGCLVVLTDECSAECCMWRVPRFSPAELCARCVSVYGI